MNKCASLAEDSEGDRAGSPAECAASGMDR